MREELLEPPPRPKSEGAPDKSESDDIAPAPRYARLRPAPMDPVQMMFTALRARPCHVVTDPATRYRYNSMDGRGVNVWRFHASIN